jgi:SIR2-like domain
VAQDHILGSGDASRYGRYVEEVVEDIGETIQQYGVQPILFIGSGLSKRYFGAPNWDELLEHLAAKCSMIDKGIGFYKQSLGGPIHIGEEFANLYQQWAWSSGHNEFPEEMFNNPEVAKNDYIKFIVAQHIRDLTPPDAAAFASSPLAVEIEALQKIKPHAIITTNYDQMLEILFPDLTPIIGQQAIKGQSVSIGEVFKIHGCVTRPSEIVLTASDYDQFTKKKKFLSAKLLTFFNEHPLIFIGYSASDPNIRAILSDIDEALPEKGGIIPNVYILEWEPNLTEKSYPAHDRLIQTEEERTVRVKLISASDFSWVFDAFAANPVLNNVNPRVLRSLLARSYELVRHDIPRMQMEANFQFLTEKVESSETFASLFGIATISDYSAASAHHKYTATQLAKKLGGETWHVANKLIEKLEADSGKNIKSGDNIYHRSEQMNKNSYHKYSEEAFDLLAAVRDNKPYELKI